MKNVFCKLSVVVVFIMSISCQSQVQQVGEDGNNTADHQERKNDQRRPNAEQTMEMMDADKDGKLASTEVKGPLQRDFSKIDTDGDGFLTTEELNNAPKREPRGGGEGRGEGRTPREH